MEDEHSIPQIPDRLYLDLRLWMAEYLPGHIDQIERLEELRIALALGCLAQAVITMHALTLMARYRPDGAPRGNDRVRTKAMELMPELIYVAEQTGQWAESDMYDCDVAGRGAWAWVQAETAKDKARNAVEVA